ncbi:TPA: relaxase/mobilization nuclease domain-containing protein [Burkholderia cenocepacia]|nr:relaxase/mobilization nuclease domain-containing protein [Burkholderia cenocepacia]
MLKQMTNADGLLLQWGDRLFYEPVRARKAPRTRSAARIGRPAALRAQIARTIQRVPEVMVKITNRKGARNGMGAIRAHLDYISRNGRVELEDQEGNLVSDRLEVRDLVQMWRSAGRGIEETSIRREAFNVMLSMPPGTDRVAVKGAARAFAREEFGEQRDYVFAAHDDEAHPHVHIVVLARGRDGLRLNPRKADIQRWRERFAQELRDRGVEANATPRHTRGVTQQYERQATKHLRARGVAARERGRPPLDSAATFDAYLPTLLAWRAVASILAASTNGGDRGMARSIANFVRRTPVMVAARDVRNSETKPSLNSRKERHLDTAPPNIEH